jgi:hypothetical protein
MGLLQDMRQVYREREEVTFSNCVYTLLINAENEDEKYLEQVYREELTKLLVKVQYYDLLFSKT